MDICDEFEEIRVGIDKDRLVSPLKQVAASVHPAIDPCGITKGEVLHDAGKRNFACLNGNMDVVGHQAESVDTAAEFLDYSLQ